MSNQLVSSGAAATQGLWCGRVANGGDALAIIHTSSGIMAFEDCENTPTQIGSTQSDATVGGTGATVYEVNACIDVSGTVIHVVAHCNDSGTRDICYNTLTYTTSWAWGTWTEIAILTNPLSGAPEPEWNHVRILCNSDGDLDCVYTDGYKHHGTTYNNYQHMRDTGSGFGTASWVTPANNDESWSDLMMHHSADADNDIGLITFCSDTTSGGYMRYIVWDDSAGSWGSWNDVGSTTTLQNYDSIGVAIVNGSAHRWYIRDSPQDLMRNTTDSTYTTATNAPMSGGVYVDANDVEYCIARVPTTFNLRLYTYDGSFTDEGDVASETNNIMYVYVSWEETNPHVGIDMVYSTNTGEVYWETYALAADAPYVYPDATLNPVYRM